MAWAGFGLKKDESQIVCVTGASGFIGSHVVHALLKHPSRFVVRACVRGKESDVGKVAHLVKMRSDPEVVGQLTFIRGNLDLLTPGDYNVAFAGADAVIHTAAVVNSHLNVDDPMRQIVAPSVAGSNHIYASVRKSGSVTRVVHTSSVAAIQAYDRPEGHVFSEKDWNDWSNEENKDYYGMAKTQAEWVAKTAAAESAKVKGEMRFDVVTINPSVVLGPCLTKAHTKASPVFIRQLIFGNKQADVPVTFVDVRDVADAHVEGLVLPQAASRRFIIAGDSDTHLMRFPQVVEHLDKLFPEVTFTFKTYGGLFYNMYWYTMMSEFEKKVSEVYCPFNNSLSKKELGITYRDIETTLKDTVASMIDTGFVKPTPSNRVPRSRSIHPVTSV